MLRSLCFQLGGLGSIPFSDVFFLCPRNLILHGAVVILHGARVWPSFVGARGRALWPCESITASRHAGADEARDSSRQSPIFPARGWHEFPAR